MTLNEWAKEVHSLAREKGWYDKPRPVAEVLLNVQGEVCELWEAYRAGRLNLQCDKPIPLDCAQEELADIIIRCLDIAEHWGVDIEHAVRTKHEYNRSRPIRHGGKLA